MIAGPRTKQKREKNQPTPFATQEECLTYYNYNTPEKKEEKETFKEKILETLEKNLEREHENKIATIAVIIGIAIIIYLIGSIGQKDIVFGIFFGLSTGVGIGVLIMMWGAMMANTPTKERFYCKHKELAWEIVMNKHDKNAVATPQEMKILEGKKFRKAITRYRKHITQAAKEVEIEMLKEAASLDRRTGIFEKV